MTDLLGDYLTQMIAWKNLPPFLDPIPMLGVAMPTVGPSAVPIMAIAKASMAENIALAAQFPLAL
ncbi:hypothetical protein [Rhizobium mongolense]|uniref:Uncharacterized protein n=1 Tax=Rhizobium mongolense TaxID=57676 RepID=A0A7W6WFK1_9HYPH|nr:hypothetical protein [Rhizobium mongolense]MBB4276592.1 hypothetical protein [Rhizobium mongolense]